MSMAPPRKATRSCSRSQQALGEGYNRGGPGGRAAHRFSRDSLLEGTGFELVWGLFCQVVVFGLLPVLWPERESRSSFFNRAADVKKVVHSGLRRIVSARWGHAIGKLPFLRFFVRPFDRPAKRHLCGVGSGLSR